MHIHELKTARLFEFCISAPFYSLNMLKEARLAKKYGNFVGKTFQIVDDIIDADQDQDNKNILNYITKNDALDLCHTYKTQADRYLSKIFPSNKNKLSEIFNYIISQADCA